MKPILYFICCGLLFYSCKNREENKNEGKKSYQIQKIVEENQIELANSYHIFSFLYTDKE